MNINEIANLSDQELADLEAKCLNYVNDFEKHKILMPELIIKRINYGIQLSNTGYYALANTVLSEARTMRNDCILYKGSWHEYVSNKAMLFVIMEIKIQRFTLTYNINEN
jgi:hypothetical protein